jgi:hypothetical protein
MCGKSQTSTTSSAPNPEAMQAYQDLLQRAGQVAQTPFVPYTGEFVAGLNQQQQNAGSNINQYAGFAQPFIQQAAGYANQAAQPLTAADIARYQSPYTQDVVNATQAQFNNQNQQQLENVRGNAAAQGALGGDREAVAEAITSGQQSLAQAPTIAGLYNQGYNTALSTAQQQQQNLGQAAYSLGNLGVAGQNAGLTGANAQLGYGTLGQSTQQAYDQALYQQFLAQQGYPFQTTQWLAGIDTAVGSQMGGTSSTTGAAPNPWSSILGLGLAGASISDRRAKEGIHKIGETNDGQPIYRYRYKGSPQWQIGLISQEVEKTHPEAVHKIGGFGAVDYKAATEDSIRRAFGGRIPGFALGGTPYGGGGLYGGGSSYIPTMQLTPGQGAPKPPGQSGQSQQIDPFKLASSTIDLNKKIKGLSGASTFGGVNYGMGDWGEGVGGSDVAEAAKAGVESGMSFDPLTGDVYARGGPVSGFDDDSDADYVPDIKPVGGHGPPDPPKLAGSGGGDNMLGNLTKLIGLFGKASGGRVRGFAGGGLAAALGPDDGDDSFLDRFAAGYDSYPYRRATQSNLDRAEMFAAQEGLQRPGDVPLGGLSLADIVQTEAPGFGRSDYFGSGRTNYDDAMRQSGDRYQAAAAATAPAAVVNPSVVNGQPQNLSGDIIPPRGTGRLPDLETADIGPAPAVRGLDVSEYAPRPGTAGAPSLPTPTKKEAEDAAKEAGFGGLLDKMNFLHLSPEMRKSMLAAGFAMMASRSPYLGNAIGEGGLAGLGAYTGMEKTQAANELAKAKLAQTTKTEEDKYTRMTPYQQQHLDYLRQHSKELLESGKYSAVPAMGTNDKGEHVPGAIIFNNKTGERGAFVEGMGPKAATAAAEPSFDKSTLTKMADQYLAGDRSVLVNLGRGAQGATDLKALRQRIAERMDDKGVTPEQQAVKMAEFQGMTAGQRALGTRTANVEMAANEARNMMPIALEAAAAVPRTHWTPINKLIERWQTGIESDPAQAKFAAANFSLVNSYVRAIAPTGVPPESARLHALQMLSGAMSHESYKAVVATMDQEMQAALHSPGQVMDKFRQMYGGDGGGGHVPAAGAPAAASAPAGGAGFTGRTATNPQTGQKLRETSSGQWVP